MRQLLHRARPEATTKAPHALEVVQTLAVALDSDAGCVRTAGDGKGRLCETPTSTTTTNNRERNHSKTRERWKLPSPSQLQYSPDDPQG